MPSFVQTNADGEKMRATAAETARELSLLRASFQKVNEYIIHLETSWQGPAYERFLATYQKDKPGFDMFVNNLVQLNDALSLSGDLYYTTEENAREAAAQRRSPSVQGGGGGGGDGGGGAG